MARWSASKGFSLCHPVLGAVLIVSVYVLCTSNIVVTGAAVSADSSANADPTKAIKPEETTSRNSDTRRQQVASDTGEAKARRADAPADSSEEPTAETEEGIPADTSVKTVKLQTPAGPLECKQVGDPNGTPVLAVHGMAKKLVWEWEEAAIALANHGCFVTMPNFHSLRSTAPGHSAPATAAAIESLIEQLKRGDEGIVLMGKSWGGGTVLNFALMHPELLSKLVMAAPVTATEDAMKELTVEKALLLWTKDDPSFQLAQTLLAARAGLEHDFQEAGGHRIVSEYQPALIKFVTGLGA